METVGDRELEILLRARRAESGSVVLQHDRESNAERMAARRLCARGLLSEPNAFGNGHIGWLYRYNLTERGRSCWLRCKARSER